MVCYACQLSDMAGSVVWPLLLLPLLAARQLSPPYVRGVGRVMMDPAELELLLNHLQQARTFFEFGTGGQFAKFSVFSICLLVYVLFFLGP